MADDGAHERARALAPARPGRRDEGPCVAPRETRCTHTRTRNLTRHHHTRQCEPPSLRFDHPVATRKVGGTRPRHTRAHIHAPLGPASIEPSHAPSRRAGRLRETADQETLPRGPPEENGAWRGAPRLSPQEGPRSAAAMREAPRAPIAARSGGFVLAHKPMERPERRWPPAANGMCPEG
jgi:hypothetical protein